MSFHRHPITELDSLPDINGRKFDIISCVSALVLLSDPAGAIKQWVRYLKPGGRLITDATHPRDEVINMILEKAMHGLEKSVPFYRSPVTGPAVLERMMGDAGLMDVIVQPLSQHQIIGKGDSYNYVCEASSPPVLRTFKVEDVDDAFSQAIKTWWISDQLSKTDEIARAKQLSKDIWIEFSGDDGLLIEVDCVFVAIGRKVIGNVSS